MIASPDPTRLVMGAVSPAARAAEARALADHLRARPGVTPDAVAAMLARTRPVRAWRAVVTARTRPELVDALDALAGGVVHDRVVVGDRPARARRVALVCPGQGSQRRGMGRALVGSPAYVRVVEECEALLLADHGLAVRDYLLGEPDGARGPGVEVVQPALTVQMLGIAAAWAERGVVPDVVVGHSLGEIAAAHLAGAVDLRDALRVAVSRSRLAARSSRRGEGTYGMAFLATDPQRCGRMLSRIDGWAELSVVNAPRAVCVSGERAAIDDVLARATDDGVFAREIGVDYPAHTSQMVPLRAELVGSLRAGLATQRLATPRIDCFSSTLWGDRLDEREEAAPFWFRNLRHVVRFDLAVAAALDAGVDLVVEAAEHPTLTAAVGEVVAATGPGDPAARVVAAPIRAEGLAGLDRAVAEVVVDHTGLDATVRRSNAAVDGPPALPLPDFPHTVLDEQPLWAPRGRPAPRAAAPAPAPEEPAPARPRRLVETWVPLARRDLVAPGPLLVLDPTGRCAATVATLVARAPRHGTSARAPGPGFEPVAAVGPDDTVVVLLPEPDPPSGGVAADLATVEGVLAGARSWVPALGVARRAWLVTVRAESVHGGGPRAVAAAAVAARCLAADHRALLRHLDVDLDLDDEPAGAGVGAEEADRLLLALHTADEGALALRDGVLHARRLVAAPAPSDPGDLGEVVVTGGTGRVGLALATELVRRGAARITLLSRRGERPELRAALAALRAGGSTVEVVSCDLADPAAVRAVADARRDRPTTLLVHAAVDYVHAEAAQVDGSGLQRAAAAKVAGLEHLVDGLALAAHARIVLCSSVAATFVGPGLALYATTNRLLDVAAARWRRDGLDARSVQWGVWRVGAATGSDGERLLAGSARSGLVAMDPAGAVVAGLTAAPGDCLVLAADWTVLRSVAAVQGSPALLADVPDVDGAPDADEAPRTGPAPAASDPAVVRALVARVMRMPEPDRIDPDVPLVALGMDSIQALELHRAVGALAGPELPVADLLRGASLGEVVDRLATVPAPRPGVS